MPKSHVLLLLQQNSKYWQPVPAQTHDYVAMRKWTLTLAGEGATGDLVSPFPNSITVQSRNLQDPKWAILRLYRLYRDRQLFPCPVWEDGIRQYSKDNQTRVLSQQCSRLVGQTTDANS